MSDARELVWWWNNKKPLRVKNMTARQLKLAKESCEQREFERRHGKKLPLTDVNYPPIYKAILQEIALRKENPMPPNPQQDSVAAVVAEMRNVKGIGEGLHLLRDWADRLSRLAAAQPDVQSSSQENGK